MAELPPAPSYQNNYAALLSNLIGGLPTDYRNAQEQQTRIDVSNAFKGGFPMNPDGTPNWAAAMQQFGQAGGSTQAADLGPLAQQQAWQQQGQAPPALLGGSGGSGAPPSPSAPQPAPIQPPAAAPAPPPSGAIAGAVTVGAGQPPTLAAIASGAPLPDPTKPKVAEWLGKALGVSPTTPLTPDQVAKAQSYLSNMLRAGGSLTAAMGVQQPPQPQNGFAGRLNVPPDPAVAGARAIAAPVGTPQPAAARDIATEETVAYGGPQRKLTQAEATAIATGNAPGTGGGAGTPFGLPPAAEAVWQRMVPQESGGRQFNADGSVVTSPKGAVGIAQVEPGTGPSAAKLAGLPWDPVRFKNDPNYNLALGRAYYAAQVSAFGSPEVAAAAYNAGPRAVLSAQAKATTRGGSYLDYLPAETRDYVAKVASGGSQQGRGGSAPQQGGRALVPQVPLPPGFSPGQEPQAIEALRNKALEYARIPGANGKATADRLNQYADEIAASIAPVRVGSGAYETILPAQGGAPLYQNPLLSEGGITPDAMRDAAMFGLKTGIDPKNLGRGIQGPQDIRNYQNLKDEIMKEQGWTPDDVAAMQQQYRASGAEMNAGGRARGSREANLSMILSVANAAIPSALDASAQVPRGKWVPINQLVQKGQVMASDPDLASFGMANLQLAEAWAKAMNPTGVMRESDRDLALTYLNTAQSPETYQRLVRQLNKQITRELTAIQHGDATSLGRPGAQDTAAGAVGGAASKGGGGEPPTVTEDEYNLLPSGSLYKMPGASADSPPMRKP